MPLPKEQVYTVDDIYALPDGVREYWIVDDERNLVTVYDFEHGNAANYALADRVPSGLYPGFFIRLSELLP